MTILGSEARLVVVVKETIQASAIDKDISGSENAQTPRFLAAGIAVAGTEVRVEVSCAGCEAAVESGGIGLHVRRFGLDDTGINILGISELKVVELAVFGAGTVHPDRSLRFDENATAVVDVDLVVVGEVELVVCDPEPVIFEVNSRFGGDMQEQKGTFTVCVIAGRDIRILGTSVALQASPSRTADAHMDIPHT